MKENELERLRSLVADYEEQIEALERLRTVRNRLRRRSLALHEHFHGVLLNEWTGREGGEQ